MAKPDKPKKPKKPKKMAAVTVASDSQRLHDMGDTDGTTGIANAAGGGGGSAPGAEPDFFYQGSSAISKKVGTARAGVGVDTSAFGTPRSVNVTGDRILFMSKFLAANKDALLGIGVPGAEIQVGSSTSDYYNIDVGGNDLYPTKGGWVLIPINMTLTENQGVSTGTPSLVAADYFGFVCDFSATSKSENVILDAVDFGVGMTLVNGDGANADGTFADFVSSDEGTVGNRWGWFSTIDDIIYCNGGHWIGRNETGTTTITEFTDAFFTLVYPSGLVGTQDTGFALDIGNASTVIDISNGSFIGKGRGQDLLFNTETDIVGGTTDEIGNAGAVGPGNYQFLPKDVFNPGDAVVVRDLDGTETPGLTDNTRVFVNYPDAGTGITLHATRRGALSGATSPQNLTASSAGNGEIWRLEKENDSRPIFIQVGTAGTLDVTNTVFEKHGLIQIGTGGTFDGCTFINCESVDLDGGGSGQGIMSNCTHINPHVDQSDWATITNDPSDISNTSWTTDATNSWGHALRCKTAGTYAFDGNSFTGYFSVTDQTLHQFDNTTDVVGGATDGITLPAGHGYVTGDGVVYSRVLTANTVVGGLTENTTYFLNQITGNQFSLHLNQGDAINDNARISLTVGTGNETHALWPANAAFYNSNGAVTLNVSNGVAMSVRNGLDATTTVDVNVTVTFDGLRDNTEVRVYNNATGVELAGIENATAGTADNRNFPASVAASTVVDYVLHNNQYEYIRVEGFTWPTSNQTIQIQQRFDRNFSNP